MTVFPLRQSLTSALLGLTLAAQAALAAPAAVTFDTTPRAGQHQRQQLDIQATIRMRAEPGPGATDEQRAKVAQGAERLAQMGPMQMSMAMEQTLQVGQPDAQGWLPLTVGIDSKGGQLTMGGKSMPMPKRQDRELSFVARFNPKDFNFQMQKVEGMPEMSELLRAQGNTMINEAMQLSKALNGRPMKVGDSVDVPLTMTLPVPLPGGAGSMTGQVHYTLARVARGVAYFDLAMELKVDMSASLPTPAAAAASAASAPDDAASATNAGGASPNTMHIVATGSGKGHSALRLSDRLPLSNQLDMDMQMTMSMPDNAVMHMDMTMMTSAKGTSLAKPAATDKAAEAKKKS